LESQLKNYHCTDTTHALWRGGNPENHSDLVHLYATGVRTIISLQSGFADKMGHYPDEKIDWELLGGSYIEIKCSNFWAPTVEQTLRALAAIDRHLLDGAVYIHCFSGVDRTGWMCAAWKLRFNAAATAWRDEAWNKGMHRWFFWWKPIFMWRYRV